MYIDDQHLDEVECGTNVLPNLNQINEIILEEINDNGNYTNNI